MANDSIHQIAAGEGESTEDQVYRKQIVRELLYRQAGNLSVGNQIVGNTTFDTLDVQFNFPGEMSAEYPVAQDSSTSRQRITWEEFDMTLRRGQTRYFIADSAKLRGVDDMQFEMTQERAGEAMARRKDENILGTLADGATSENTDSTADWTQDSTDVVDQMHDMWTDILVNAPINNMNISNFSVVLPVEVWAETNQVELINNVQQQLQEYLGQTFGFSIYPTKLGMHEDDQVDMQDTAFMMIPGQETAIHGVLSEDAANAEGVPLVEEERQTGKGDEYVVNQWFNTSVMEHESGGADETPRIAVRNGVNS
jgi:hypothetical protein